MHLNDIDEAILLSDRIIVLTRRPGRIKANIEVHLPRPRDVAEVRTTPRFIALHDAIWAVLRAEVLKGYEQQLKKAS